MTAYPHLFSPIHLGPFEVPNRVVMGSMHLGLEEQRGGWDVMARFYAERAAGGVGLIVTGGISPTWEGALAPGGAFLRFGFQVPRHRKVTDAVHAAGGRICLQLLHGGRYSFHPLAVAPSPLRSPISKFTPRALSERGIERTIRGFARAARLAQKAGYDGVEVMGSEGYLINQFLAAPTNQRTDAWGGSIERRMQFPVRIVQAIRAAVGPDFLVIFRISVLDLVPGGATREDVLATAQAIEAAGANVLTTGIGWHEARIPTIATVVPHGAFAFATRALREAVGIPVIATNRFNTPEACEEALEQGDADLVSMARPFLADADWVAKAQQAAASRINVCIACNQACLDRIFTGKTASCLVNPRAGRESTWPRTARATRSLRVAVVGGGMAGMSCAAEAADLGHEVTLFESKPTLGGQFRLAMRVPGKADFEASLQHFASRLDGKVSVRLGSEVTVEELHGYDAVVVATGVVPRKWNLAEPGDPRVVSYPDVLEGRAVPGQVVAIIGAGGIGFDVADFLTHDGDAAGFHAVWGIDRALAHPGGLVPPVSRTPARQVHLFQRSADKLGGRLGKTTGWIHRATLKARGVQFHPGVSYEGLGPEGLRWKDAAGAEHCLAIDHAVVCAGQTSVDPFSSALRSAGIAVHVIGGAREAGELDAERAIREGIEAAYALAPWTAAR
jgi:2,4-dienoyl-CoA reductase (NADPH2)